MKDFHALLLALLAFPASLQAQSDAGPATAKRTFEDAQADLQRRLDEAVAELDSLRKRIAEEKIPLSRRLSELEGDLQKARQEHQQTTRLLDGRTLDLSNLRNEIKARQEEKSYLSNLLSEYARNFESRLHVAELQRHAGPLEQAKLAHENTTLTGDEVLARQAALLATSITRLEDAVGGTRFEGTAVGPDGAVRHGTFALVGPAAWFRSADGAAVGTAEQRLGSLEPAQIPFERPEDHDAAAAFVASGAGLAPIDTTLGNAHKVAATQETFVEHVKKGGPVLVPIFLLAGAAFLVALYRWLGLAFLRSPSRARIQELHAAVARRDHAAAQAKAAAIGGPVGAMLVVGVAHLDEPRELVEEVLFENVLTTRLRLQRFLPFIAISAAAAPLLGLLGTVTGIMNTFQLITVFGTGDVKTLSSGISEALITTEFGLIVAIPSLLIHAFLTRKAKRVVDDMETAAVGFLNQLAKAGPAITPDPEPTPALVPEPKPLVAVA
ncbi:MAG: MotA/TolQ/ExbB proton channel family protein [Planctomycetes bacterium]|nr:MotA/TolQ/ExbB proton channel family protein [Planctomycetota bacterium]